MIELKDYLINKIVELTGQYQNSKPCKDTTNLYYALQIAEEAFQKILNVEAYGHL